MTTSFEATLIDHANPPHEMGLKKSMTLASDIVTVWITHIRRSFKERNKKPQCLTSRLHHSKNIPFCFSSLFILPILSV